MAAALPLRVDFSTSLCAPARMSIGDFARTGAAPDVGEIEISSSSLKSRPPSVSTISVVPCGTDSNGFAPACSAFGSTTNGSSSLAADAAAAAAAAAATPPESPNIGLLGSSCRPRPTAFCHVSPWPCDTE